MLKKYLLIISVAAIFLFTFTSSYAQDQEAEKTAKKMTQQENIQKYMKIIASDSTMRIEMMNLMIKNGENDKNALMGMGQAMIKNPEMHKIMSEMLNNDESIKVKKISDEKSNENMMMESTKTIKKPKYD